MKKKKHDVKFTNKGNSRRGMLSLAESAVSLVWLGYAVWQTYCFGSHATKLVGGVGMLVLVWQVVSLVTALRSLREEDVFRGLPKLAVAAAVLMLLVWLSVYGLGIAVLLGY